MKLPRMVKIGQRYPSLGLADLTGELNKILSDANLQDDIKPGMLVGITAGSRGIANINLILRALAGHIRFLGGRPVLLAAMGSHGGGNPAGQAKLLSSLGITERDTGAGIICSAQSVVIGKAFYGEIHLIDKALKCDAVIVVNRIKPHTSFHGDFESGLMKMLAVGLGGPAGAASLHRSPPHLLDKAVAEAGMAVLKSCRVVLGLAILEDAYDATRKIVAIKPADIYKREKELLAESRQYLPGLPVTELDVLVVDEIGKVFSGTGMDTNVIGRLRIQGVPEPKTPRIKRIIALDVAPEAHGNAYGIGLADFTTLRLAEKFDRESAYLNALTSTFVQRVMMPMILPDDREALKAALKSLGGIKPQDIRIIRIHNTLRLSEMLVSENVYKEISGSPAIKALSPPQEITFGQDGNLPPF
ncbi:MAG: hypothetical protein KBA08_09310 [Firmicutes bacterium]|nr:hypothetical protein [Bacillota bacterium]